MTKHTTTEWFLHKSGQAYRLTVGNLYVRSAAKLATRFGDWNSRNAKAYAGVRSAHQASLKSFNEAGSRSSMLGAAAKVVGLGAVRIGTGVGTVLTRAALWVGGTVALIAATAPVIVTGLAVGCLPMLALAAATETIHEGAIGIRGIGRFFQRVGQRFNELGKSKAVATPAVATDGPAQLAEAPAVAVAAPAAPVAPQPRLSMPQRAATARQASGSGLAE